MDIIRVYNNKISTPGGINIYYVVKINIVSMLFALYVVLNIQLILNYYRISRITGLSFAITEIISLLFMAIGWGIFTIFAWKCITKYLGKRISNLLIVLLCIPYYLLFMRLFVALFPITDRGEIPPPIVGLIMSALLIFFAIYITLLIALATLNFRSEVNA